MTCKNHPNLRWTRKSREHMAGAMSNNIKLMFKGDITKPEGRIHPFFTDGGDLGPMKAEYEAAGFVFECECPYADLEFIEPKPAIDSLELDWLTSAMHDEELS